MGIHKSTFYNWLKRYEEDGIDGLAEKKPRSQAVWNEIAEAHCEAIIELALDKPDLSPLRAGGEIHRREGILHLTIQRLQAAEGAGPDHQSCLYPDASQ